MGSDQRKLVFDLLFNDLFEQPRKTGRVASRPGKASDEAAAHGID